MNPRLLELAARQGALKARIAAQREALAQHARPLEEAFGVADKGLAGLAWLKQHPAVVAGAVALLAVLRPRRAWRWGQRGFFLWRGWQHLRISLAGRR